MRNPRQIIIAMILKMQIMQVFLFYLIIIEHIRRSVKASLIVEAFPIDLDNDGNIGQFEDDDDDPMTSAQEQFDLAFVLTSEGIVIIDSRNG